MAAKSITVTAAAADALRALERYASERGGTMERAPLQNGTRVRLRLGASSPGVNVYPSKAGGCKLVFDQPEGADADAIAAMLAGRPSETKARKSAGGAIAPVLADAPCWIGSDESGKGDYFGPLVVAAVALTSDNWRVLEALGVQDSKNLTDARARSLAGEIQDAFPHEVVVILPRRYNELWAKFRNVNRLLAWAHARAIEQVAEAEPRAVAAVADQFGDEALIREALFKRGRGLRLVQMPRAEADPAVAAASILARAEFLRRLESLGRQAGVQLPKGASATVEAVARGLVASRGRGILDELAKAHFKTTQRVM
ncbi:MAG TPA: ribonuclease HIII [Dehalococcoidia bacterium]|nr:ribonuclease HIII [Dehalococcoidia bacterium]